MMSSKVEIYEKNYSFLQHNECYGMKYDVCHGEVLSVGFAVFFFFFFFCFCILFVLA